MASLLLAVLLSLVVVSCASPKLKGHLQPLGSHREPDVPIDEFDTPLDPDTFFFDYVLPFRPVVFRGAARHSPAFRLWTDEYLAKEYGSLEVRLEEKVEGESNDALPVGQLGIGRDVIENFLSHYRSSNGYLVTELPSPMFKDVAVLPCMACSVLQHKIQEVNLWLSAQGAYSKIHRDAFNAINCLLNGTKDWFFIDKKYDKEVYVVHKSKWEMGGMSLVEPKKVDLHRFPKFADVHYSFVTIRAGDCLYVPGGYYHQVRSYGSKNMAVSLLFSQMVRNYHSGSCESGELRYKLLNESEVFWPYRGAGVMSMGNMDIEFFRNLVDNFTLSHGNRLTSEGVFEALVDLLKPASEQTSKVDVFDDDLMQELRDTADKIVGVLQQTVGKKDISVEDLEKVGVEMWKRLSKMVEPDDISNTYNFEYSIIEGAEVNNAMIQFFRTASTMYEKDFVELYTQKVHGSEYIGRKTFAKLDAKKNGHITFEQYRTELRELVKEIFSTEDHRDDVDETEEEAIRDWAHRKENGEESKREQQQQQPQQQQQQPKQQQQKQDREGDALDRSGESSSSHDEL